jgi:NTP pyrophosphatase (non-canonical NTP hydrolase)
MDKKLFENLNELSQEIHKDQVAKGFYDNQREDGTLLMLINSELCESMEALRHDKYSNIKQFEYYYKHSEDIDFKTLFENNIKDTHEDEIADAFIRLLDYAAYKNIDLAWHANQKLKYNALRPHKHDKKF